MKKLPITLDRTYVLLSSYLLLSFLLSEQVVAGKLLEPPQSLVSGVVTGTEGIPLAGVNIVVGSTNRGTITDMHGSFEIIAGSDDVLVFSIVGFKSLSVAVSGKDIVNVQMEEDVTVLGEVVLNAGYYTVSEKEKTGSIVKVETAELEKQPINSPLAALQGRMAGVKITQSSNLPGAAPSIQIRGQNSLRPGGNYPLYIIDGVPVNASPLPGSGLLSLGIDPLNTMNLSNIESIEILKDADATAIYGSRGANGVVLITTKKGTVGKTSFLLGGYSGVGTLSNAIDVLNTQQYLEMRNEAFANDGATPFEFNAPDLLLWDQERNTDWKKELLGHTAYITDVQASVSGGSDQTVFLVGGSLHRESMVFPGDFGYRKATANVNLGHTSRDQRFKLSLSANYGVDKNKLFYDAQFIQKAILLAPNAPALYNAEGDLNWENSTWANPLADLRKTQVVESHNLVANLSLSYLLAKGLTLKGNFGYMDLQSEETYRDPISAYDPAIQPYLVNSSRQNTAKRRSMIVEPQLDYALKLGKLGVQMMIGGTFQESMDNQLFLLAEGYADESLMDNLANAANVYVSRQNDIDYKYSAIFGRLALDWDKRYFVNLTGRRDGSSRFAPQHRFGNFGALGAAWIFSKEPWMERNLPFLSFGKLRGSYGSTGNDQIADYGYLDAYAPTNGEGGLYPIQLGNPDYSWEENKKLEAGLSLGFLQDRLQMNASWYRNRSSNQLVGYNLPTQTGFSSIQANLPATVQNTGWELEVDNSVRLGKVQWRTTINLTWPKNELLEFPGIEQSSYANTYRIGESLQSSLLYQFQGVDQETGLYGVSDSNDDGTINFEDRTVVKDFVPQYYGGVNTGISLGSFQMDFLFEFVKQLGRNHLAGFATPPGWQGFVGGNQPLVVLDRWRQAGDQSDVQLFTQSMGYTEYDRAANSDLSVTDASYVRLKTLSLSYQLSSGLIHGLGIENCTVYVHGQNLLTFTGYQGLDPQANRGGSLFSLPPLRTITLGAKFQF